MNPIVRWRRFALWLLPAALLSSLPAGAASDSLAKSFITPPRSARPQVWWHWMNGSVTKEGITADLEALAAAGIGGVQVFDTALIDDHRTFVPSPVKYLSPAWQELRRHAIREAGRLGLEVAFHASAGYSESGGPWVTPENSMQHLVWSELHVAGPAAPVRLLPPPVHYGLFQGPPQPGHRSRFAAEPTDLVRHYHDIAVLAFRTPLGDGEPEAVPVKVTSNVPLREPGGLRDHNEATRETLPLPTAGKPVWIQYDYAAPIVVRSAVVACQAWNWFQDGELQVSDDGVLWRTVKPLTGIVRWDRFLPATTAIPESRAGHFRFLFTTAVARAKRIDLSEIRLSPAAHLDHWETKSAYAPALIPKTQAVTFPGACAIPAGEVQDLTALLKPDGTLDWRPPEGNWTVIRMGYAPMGMTNHPAMPEAVGLEVDKLSRPAVEAYFAGGPGKIIASAGDAAGSVLTGMLMDSWEVFTSNWTPAFRTEFRRRRGYDLLPWLPVFAGRIVGSPELSERFLFDVRRTLSDLLLENYYEALTALTHQHGLQLQAEAPGRNWPTVTDIFAAKGRVDVPMGEFWNEEAFSNDAKQTAAAAELYGKRIVSSEAFTSEPEHAGWQESPARYKAIGDRYFAAGINQFVLHTVIHQPWTKDHVPGLTLGAYGSHFDRNNGWLAAAGLPWTTYLARCQLLLRQGLPVVDVCVFVGEDVPNDLPLRGELPFPLPPGYDFGGFSGDALRLMTVRDGRVVLPSGMSFAALVLPDDCPITLATARKLHELVTAGATVIGRKPLSSPSLAEYPAGDAEIGRLLAELWPKPTGANGETRLGRGRVVRSLVPLKSALPPDFDYDRSQGAELIFSHRRDGARDIYFVANQTAQPVRLDATFRVDGRIPELWDAENGTILDAPGFAFRDGLTRVPLQLGSQSSVFVVFQRPATGTHVTAVWRDGIAEPLAVLFVPAPGAYSLQTSVGTEELAKIQPLPAPVALTGPWQVSFPANKGAGMAPLALTLHRLESWTENPDPRLRYFSGTATYSTEFTLPHENIPPQSTLTLDLGRVETFASVTLNGHGLRTLWRAPAMIDVTAAVQPGRNHLEVRVTNLLVNRLIGDQFRSPAERLTWSTYTPYTKDSPLLPAGLLGPVSLFYQARPLGLARTQP